MSSFCFIRRFLNWRLWLYFFWFLIVLISTSINTTSFWDTSLWSPPISILHILHLLIFFSLFLILYGYCLNLWWIRRLLLLLLHLLSHHLLHHYHHHLRIHHQRHRIVISLIILRLLLLGWGLLKKLHHSCWVESF